MKVYLLLRNDKADTLKINETIVRITYSVNCVWEHNSVSSTKQSLSEVKEWNYLKEINATNMLYIYIYIRLIPIFTTWHRQTKYSATYFLNDRLYWTRVRSYLITFHLCKYRTWFCIYGLPADWTFQGSNTVGARFPSYDQSGPGSNPVSYKMGNGYFRGWKRRGVALITQQHLAPRLKK